eukprot:scaffold75005_cov75-Phaeocystis_antarctica.AAC.2
MSASRSAKSLGVLGPCWREGRAEERLDCPLVHVRTHVPAAARSSANSVLELVWVAADVPRRGWSGRGGVAGLS